ncbi:YetF domain-containing protein [Peribacillus kribbensis]|uniref:YetF domain-containing protein n=1 Tax=Peribacillus kribbensis TaxID=356658 RepID=UPI00047B68EB|nr:DUF421 domain-containing protein [Peribacillus kribbensis]
MDYSEASLRVICSFTALLILTKFMGKKVISQMNVFTFVTAITIGNIAASLSTNIHLGLDKGIFILAGWAVLTVFSGYLSLKFPGARRVMGGESTIVIQQGKILEGALKQNGLDIESLKGMLREQNIFSLKDVEFAIFEISGNLSVLKKSDPYSRKRTIQKVLLFPTSAGVISNGEINHKKLSDLNLSAEWLRERLKEAGVPYIKDVFYGEIQPDGTLYIDFKDDLL